MYKSSPYADDGTLKVETPDLKPKTRELINAFLKEINTLHSQFKKNNSWDMPKLKVSVDGLTSAQALLALDGEDLRAATLQLTQLFEHQCAKVEDAWRQPRYLILSELLKIIYNTNAAANADFANAVADILHQRDYPRASWDESRRMLVLLFENVFSRSTLNAGLIHHAEQLLNAIDPKIDRVPCEKVYAPMICSLRKILTPKDAPLALAFDVDEYHEYVRDPEWRIIKTFPVAWVEPILTDIAAMPSATQQIWLQYFQHATNNTGSAPSKSWLKQCNALVAPLKSGFSEQLADWLNLIMLKAPRDRMPFNMMNSLILKGVLWSCSTGNAKMLAPLVGEIVLFCYGKLSNIGARDAQLGNAGLTALGLMGSPGVVQLSKLRGNVKYNAGKRLIEKTLTQAAARLGVTKDDLEEIAVPEFGFNPQAKLEKTFGEYCGCITLNAARKVDSTWTDSKGKVLKSVPAPVKSAHADAHKQWQNNIKEINDVIQGQIDRLEQSFLSKRSWKFSDWQERFQNHDLLGWLGKRLIWAITDNGLLHNAISLDGVLVDSFSLPHPPFSKSANVQLWHPVTASVEEVQRWRALVVAHQIVQPIKQAHREVYLVTPAELETATYSNRFAAHILRQHELIALCKERGWTCEVRGDADRYIEPSRFVAQYGIGISLDMQGVSVPGDHFRDSYVDDYVMTKQITFHTEKNKCEPLESIPPLVFSEAMRDVDLFVGACSIGTDAAVSAAGGLNLFAGYFHDFATADLTASAMIRKEVLDNVISKLEIAPRCRIDGKYLIVRGDLRTYKIHLGSGNILMQPNDQYLCIVTDYKKSDATFTDLYLPFEGDHMMSLILSRAVLLAKDNKITDASILQQIQGNDSA